MKVSLNELTAAIKRAFEGLGFNLGDYEDAADILTWLEMHGLQGLQELHRALPYLGKDECTPAAIVYEDDGLAVVDTHGNGSLAYTELAAGLAYSKAMQNGFAQVRLDHSHNRKMIIKSLVNCAQRGMNCLAFWRNGQDPVIEHVVSIGAYEAYPNYQQYRVGAQRDGGDKQSITILCSSNFSLLQGFAAKTLNPDAAQVESVSAEAMAASHALALEEGIEIDEALWNELNALTQRVLVESTETSRQGAGA